MDKTLNLPSIWHILKIGWYTQLDDTMQNYDKNIYFQISDNLAYAKFLYDLAQIAHWVVQLDDILRRVMRKRFYVQIGIFNDC